MKAKYTKRQITEAIAYWKRQLKKINESSSFGEDANYELILNGRNYSLDDGETSDIGEDFVESPYVQIYVNDDDSVECVIYSKTSPDESFAFTVRGLSGNEVRAKNLHRTQMQVVKN